MINNISILTGIDKQGHPEPVGRVELKMGDVVSIVGPTGSGKTTLINDLELFANSNTPTGRKILINGAFPPAEYLNNPSGNPIALITQHTSFLSDLPVADFLITHARIRCTEYAQIDDLLQQTLDFANQLTGEPVLLHSRMTELSGGQTRALLIADATVICNTPIVLLDEVENAGINRARALELLRAYQKIFIFVTHDPRIALLSDYRIVMKNGSIVKLQYSSTEEQQLSRYLTKIDNVLSQIREKIRLGETICRDVWEGLQ
ncbi:MAG: ATP-binding cassette domain-containing protein [Bacillota bacterium]|jgi:ABC-type lipoprotein export system ATPase subunit